MTDPFAASGPVFTVGGERSPDLARDCLRVEVSEGTDGLRSLKLDLVAVGGQATGPQSQMNYLDGRIVDFGTPLTMVIGPEGSQHLVFDGTVSGIEAVYADGTPPRVIVYAEDALMRLRMTRRMRTYTDVTDADIARQLADAHGLDADVSAEGPRFDVVQQVNQSDLAFLRERARRIQAEIWCEGRTLHFSTRDRRSGTRVRLIKGGDLISIRLLADLSHQRSEVLVSGYDAASAQVIDERVGNEVIAAEVGAGRTGPQLVESALGPSRTIRFREVAKSGDQARAWARAEMLRRARGFVTVDATTRGTSELMVGSIVELHDVGQPFEGDGYYVTSLCHTYDLVAGFRTRFEGQRGTVNAVG